jgi:hypothetical protein
MRMGDALGVLAWPLSMARAARAELGARVDPIARLVSRRLGRGRRGAPSDGDQHSAPVVADLRARAEAARFWLGPARSAAPPAVWGALVDPEPGELPAVYGVDRAVLVPRDPWWIFVFWEITPATHEAAIAALGAEASEARPMLRVYDVTFVDPRGSNTSLSFDVEVPDGVDSWYVNVGRPAASYCVEVGVRTASGRFLPLVRSNVGNTPRATPSPDREVRWLEFGPTGPAWSSDQRAARATTAEQASDDQLAPGH